MTPGNAGYRAGNLSNKRDAGYHTRQAVEHNEVLMGAFGPPNSILGNLFSPIFRWFGPSATGAIYSFGYTLIVGVIFSNWPLSTDPSNE